MTQLIITRGYPASGKSTWAKSQATHPGWARVCRDDLRAMLFGQEGVLPHDLETVISAVEHAQVEALLKTSVSVIVDATHLRLRYARVWADLAARIAVDFTVKDFPLDADECVRRAQVRHDTGGRLVSEYVIREMAAKFPIDRWPEVTPRAQDNGAVPAPYVPDPALPPAYLVDMDGTLASMGDRRGPYDWHRVGEDEPIQAVLDVVDRLTRGSGRKVIVMSGRDEVCRDITLDWLYKHDVRCDELLMRPPGTSARIRW